jgi:hypothetical protein
MKRLIYAMAILLGSTPVLAQQVMRAPASPTMNVELERMPVPAAPVLFQVVTNPTTVEFTSADHNAVVDGTAVVTRYDVQVLNGAQAIVKTIDAGKPTSTTTTVTYAQLATGLAGLPSASYTVRIVAVGPGGASAPSVASDPFRRLTPPATTNKPVVK